MIFCENIFFSEINHYFICIIPTNHLISLKKGTNPYFSNPNINFSYSPITKILIPMIVDICKGCSIKF